MIKFDKEIGRYYREVITEKYGIVKTYGDTPEMVGKESAEEITELIDIYEEQHEEWERE